tara:strand:+ start:700 stop:1026 length:327 start_codon:yes stop_codon:yes gene_type:complete
MKQLIKWIVDFIISFLKDMMSKTKIKELEEEVKDASQKADEDVKHANKGYDDFMAKYNAYKSDLKRRGHEEVSTLRRDAGELRRSSEESEEGDRKPESSDKETKELDK